MSNQIGRDLHVLGVLSTSNGQPWTPVQVQKMFFLLDKKIPGEIGGPRWGFYAYDYGPFDPAVYAEIEALENAGKASVDHQGVRVFRLTPTGQQEGERALASLTPHAQDFVRRLSKWVRSLSFPQLVSAVYNEFPEMRERSVFRG